MLLCVNLISLKKPDGSYYRDQLYLSNFATLNVKDDLARIKGVGAAHATTACGCGSIRTSSVPKGSRPPT
jgi:hypothetical protein